MDSKSNWIYLILFFNLSCGDNSSSDDNTTTEPTTPTGDTLTLSENFSEAGCASTSCHGQDGKRKTTLHDSAGNPVTDLSSSTNNLAYWKNWIRTAAKSPMPTFTTDQYPDKDLENDYQALTGKSE